MAEVKKEVKKEAKVETPKEVRVPKKICELSGSIGWVSFTTKQLAQLGLDPNKDTTSDLRKLVFNKLGIQ